MRELLRQQKIFEEYRYQELELALAKNVPMNSFLKFDNQKFLEKFYKNIPVQEIDFNDLSKGLQVDSLDTFLEKSTKLPLTGSYKNEILEKDRIEKLNQYKEREKDFRYNDITKGIPLGTFGLINENEVTEKLGKINDERLYELSKLENHRDFNYYEKLDEIVDELTY